MEKIEEPKYMKLYQFVLILLRLIDEGKTINVDEVCSKIDSDEFASYIIEVVTDIKMTEENIKWVCDFIKNKYLSTTDARDKVGIENNGLLYLIYIISRQINDAICATDVEDCIVDCFLEC